MFVLTKPKLLFILCNFLKGEMIKDLYFHIHVNTHSAMQFIFIIALNIMVVFVKKFHKTVSVK